VKFSKLLELLLHQTERRIDHIGLPTWRTAVGARWWGHDIVASLRRSRRSGFASHAAAVGARWQTAGMEVGAAHRNCQTSLESGCFSPTGFSWFLAVLILGRTSFLPWGNDFFFPSLCVITPLPHQVGLIKSYRNYHKYSVGTAQLGSMIDSTHIIEAFSCYQYVFMFLISSIIIDWSNFM
jgi:hypothetical protein